MNQHRIVVVGGGIAGMIAATRLGRSLGQKRHASVTLVDHNPAHVWKPMLHRFACGTAEYRSESLSFVDHAARNGLQYRLGDFVALDRSAKTITIEPVVLRGIRMPVDCTRIGYDTLILATGSRSNDFDTPGVKEHCHHLDDIVGAQRFNAALLRATADCLARKADLRIAIVGGGATGVELAAELIKAHDVVSRYGVIGGGTIGMRLSLVESGARLLGPLPDSVSKAALTKLREMGIAVELGARVVSADGAGFLLKDGRRVDADLLIWAAGIKAPRLPRGIEGMDLDKGGQMRVRPTLQTTCDGAVFVIGDNAKMEDEDGDPVPATAQAARQQAIHLAKCIRDVVREGAPLRPFHYDDLGSIVSLGGYAAYGTLGRHGILGGGFLQGRMAQFGHAAIYRAHQVELNGLWRGIALWLSDGFRRAARPAVRLD